MGIQPIQIVMIVSAVLGQLLLIASVLALDLNQDDYEGCKELIAEGKQIYFNGTTKLAAWDEDPCKDTLIITTGAIFGLIAAIIQILSAAICFQKPRVVPWCGATIAVFIFAIIGFSLPLSTPALSDENFGLLRARSRASKYGHLLDKPSERKIVKIEFALAIAGMDFCFALLAIAFGAFTIIRSKAAVGVAGTPSNVGVVGAPSRSSNVGGKRISARPIPPSNPEPDTTGVKV